MITKHKQAIAERGVMNFLSELLIEVALAMVLRAKNKAKIQIPKVFAAGKGQFVNTSILTRTNIEAIRKIAIETALIILYFLGSIASCLPP